MKIILEYECKVKIHEEVETQEVIYALSDDDIEALKNSAEKSLKKVLEDNFCVNECDSVDINSIGFKIN